MNSRFGILPLLVALAGTASLAQEAPLGADCGLDQEGCPEVDGLVPIYTLGDTVVEIVQNAETGSFTHTVGETHRYEVIYLPEGGVNWVQARYLGDELGGYLATVTIQEEAHVPFRLSSYTDDREGNAYAFIVEYDQ